MRLHPGDVVLFDLDGTLVDTSYQHALAWYRSFLDAGLTPPVWRIHRAIGMGGDQLVAAVAGERAEEEMGDALRAEHGRRFAGMLDDVRAFQGATELLSAVRAAGAAVVLASSAGPTELEHYVDLLDARSLADVWTGAQDVQATKPEPDLVRVALDAVGGFDGVAVMVGDSTWDVVAAARAGLPTVGLLTGGYGADELREAGAVEVHEDLAALQHSLVGG